MVKHIYYCLAIIAQLLIASSRLLADGSRDLYPAGATGNRAYLYSNTGTPTPSFPFKTSGTHYVYAASGETIAAASSAQGLGSARTSGWIILTSPNGTVYSSPAGSTTGRILNRAAELAGPQFPGQGAGATVTCHLRVW